MTSVGEGTKTKTEDVNSGDIRSFPSDDSCMPATNAGYLSMKYWDERFEKEEEYEWFKGYADFRHLVQEHVKPSARVLVLGCGNSHLSESLYQDGCVHVTSTDLSPVVISRMRERCATNGCQGIRWEVADMLHLPFQDNSWDCVIEKGAMDVLFVDQQSPWDPSEEVQQRVTAMMTEAHRVLTENGLFISITFGQPHFRRRFFEAEGLSWEMRYQTFGESFHYYFYTLYKGSREPTAPKMLEPIPAPVADMEHEYMDDENYLSYIQEGTQDLGGIQPDLCLGTL